MSSLFSRAGPILRQEKSHAVLHRHDSLIAWLLGFVGVYAIGAVVRAHWWSRSCFSSLG
jgi:hypothetical protein